MSDEKEKRIEQLLYITKQQNEQIACLTDLLKCNANSTKEISISHDKAFTEAFISSLISLAITIIIVVGIVFIYENQFMYSSNTVTAEGTEANAQYIGGDYNSTTEGSEH